MQESMGRVVDRTREHLIPTDRAVVVARQLLLRAIQTVEAGGDPPGVGNSYAHARAIEDIVPPHLHWREALGPRIYPAPERAAVSAGA